MSVTGTLSGAGLRHDVAVLARFYRVRTQALRGLEVPITFHRRQSPLSMGLLELLRDIDRSKLGETDAQVAESKGGIRIPRM